MKQPSDLTEAQLAIDPPQEDLPIRLRQLMQQPPQPRRLILPRYLLLRRFAPRGVEPQRRVLAALSRAVRFKCS